MLIALILNYLTPVHSILSTSTIIKLLMSLLFVGTPIFFAAICFALLFRDSEATDLAYGWNVLGAVIGGLIEFFSMLIGLKALTLVALVSYVIAVVVRSPFSVVRATDIGERGTDSFPSDVNRL